MLSLDPGLIDPFVDSTVSFFAVAMAVHVTPGEPSLKQDPQASHDCSVIISISGELLGSVVLSFPEKVVKAATVRMLKEDIDVTPRQIADAVGEFGNIIVGGAKKALKRSDMEMTLPKVIMGYGHTVWECTEIPSVIVPFESEWGPFALEISFKTR